MSASVSGSMISLTRGDTLRLTIGIIQNGEPYEPNPGDIVRFALKKKIKELDISRLAMIVMIRRKDQVIIPRGDTVIRADDKVIMYTKRN